ncbi:SDR family NAD(P)-dependent oxidoreductase [Aliiroseovarius crassostreae]|uniref:SDR family NAD(P)-dependent oxidoreductase n=1 Tax=Aliiroseovarius crassostreae TaxID=154981 RepID=UPI002204BCC4|nr:SDR family NAD(P)-dependent oxidoreductase [Aliiroseovarius crassostreae]UWP89151.1 SDR family NAD(P)-dependent oxidoreductase [Aliiroseovarius crassostreae]UWQ01793.1 SDR family NAD(P)-dependent oxidoreductase [Aliiroseovarius crassostreae]
MNILITGASSGFGKEMAVKLAEAGHTVFAGMRALKGRNAVAAAELGATAGQIVPIELDVSSDASVDTGIAQLMADLDGPLDVVINNAGIYVGGLNETISAARFQNMLNVNVLGPVRVLRAVLPNMRARGSGTVISITSDMSRFALPMSGLYTASKAALEMVAETYALELAPLGLESLIVQPGAFDTGIMQKSPSTEEPERIGGYTPTLAQTQSMAGRYMALAQKSFVEASPAMVADAIVDLLNLPYGHRPLRTVVDPSVLGAQAQAMNAAIASAQEAFLGALGVDFSLVSKEAAE